MSKVRAVAIFSAAAPSRAVAKAHKMKINGLMLLRIESTIANISKINEPVYVWLCEVAFLRFAAALLRCCAAAAALLHGGNGGVWSARILCQIKSSKVSIFKQLCSNKFLSSIVLLLRQVAFKHGRHITSRVDRRNPTYYRS